MTDEERKKLVNRLRLDVEPTEGDCEDAADEIERLSEENDRFRRALVSAWRKIEEDAVILDPERSET